MKLGLMLRYAGAAAFAIFVAGTVLPAVAAQSTAGKTIQVVSTFTEPLSSADGIRCRGGRAPGCTATEKTTTTFEGVLTGVATAEVVGLVASDGAYHFTGTWTLAHATVDGCGRGGLVLEMFDGVVAPNPDATAPLAGEMRWRVRRGNGTGDLARVTAGEGEAAFVFAAAEITTPRWVQGELRGAITCGPVPPPRPSPATEVRTIQVQAEYTEPIPDGGLTCSGLGTESATCQAWFPGPATFTGTISGVASAQSVGPTKNGHHYEGPDIFDDAVVEGCGRGGFIIDTFDGEMHPEDVAADGSTGGYNRWRLRPGSGTGGLSGLISGEGENDWRQHWPDTGTDTWGRGVFTGTITCAVTKPAAVAAAEAGRGAAMQPGVLPETGRAQDPWAGVALLVLSLAARRWLRVRRGW